MRRQSVIFCCMVKGKLRKRQVAVPFLNWEGALTSSFLLILICDNDDAEPAAGQKSFQILASSPPVWLSG